MFITLISAGNGGKVKPEPTERRIVSGDPPHGEFEATHSRPPVTEVKQSPNRQNGELSAATRRTCKNGGFVVQ